VLVRAAALVQHANAVPHVRVLGVLEVEEGVLVRRVGVLKVIPLKVGIGEGGPGLAILGLGLDGTLEPFRGLCKLLLLGEDGRDGRQRLDIVGVVAKAVLVGYGRLVELVHRVTHRADFDPARLVGRCEVRHDV